ncbi:MAG TPA: MerR family transcriptional regulator [Chloroflexota bacterium]
MVENLAIGEVARRAGIRTSAIRYYEQVGLLPVPRRASGRRRYDPDILDRIALIQFAQRAGFTVGEIRTLFEGFEEGTPMSARWQVLAHVKLAEVDEMMDRAQRMRSLLDQALTCGCLRLEDCARAIHGSALGECLPIEDRSPARE